MPKGSKANRCRTEGPCYKYLLSSRESAARKLWGEELKCMLAEHGVTPRLIGFRRSCKTHTLRSDSGRLFVSTAINRMVDSRLDDIWKRTGELSFPILMGRVAAGMAAFAAFPRHVSPGQATWGLLMNASCRSGQNASRLTVAAQGHIQKDAGGPGSSGWASGIRRFSI